MERLSNCVEETESIAADFARTLQGGECLALHGDLGAGKTQFVRGLVLGLGGDPRAVSSPTFVLLNVYKCPRVSVYHLDAYRLSGPDDLEAIGFTEFAGQDDVVVVVEWAERVLQALPAGVLDIRIAHVGESIRIVDLPSY